MLTERRKADRAEMVAQLAAIAQGFGFGVEQKPEPSFLGKRASIIRFSFPHGLGLSMDFNGASCQPDTFVVSWVMRGPEAEGRRLALGFGGLDLAGAAGLVVVGLLLLVLAADRLAVVVLARSQALGPGDAGQDQGGFGAAVANDFHADLCHGVAPQEARVVGMKSPGRTAPLVMRSMAAICLGRGMRQPDFQRLTVDWSTPSRMAKSRSCIPACSIQSFRRIRLSSGDVNWTYAISASDASTDFCLEGICRFGIQGGSSAGGADAHTNGAT